MSKVQILRSLVKQRLTAAAEEICALFERTIAEYEEELCRSTEQNQRHRNLLDSALTPQLRLHRAGSFSSFFTVGTDTHLHLCSVASGSCDPLTQNQSRTVSRFWLSETHLFILDFSAFFLLSITVLLGNQHFYQ